MKQPDDIELATGVRTAVSRLVKKVRKEASFLKQLSLTEHMTMSAMFAHTQLLPSELSKMGKVSSQAMSQILNHLSELKYITRKSSKEDKRKTIVSITEKGKGFIIQSRLEKEEWLAKAIRETLTKDEKKLLREGIALLIRIADFED